jgi:hypothetical protein
MSVSTPKRLFLCIIAVLIGTTAFASHPSPRAQARLAYDAEDRVAILFGGRGRFDPGTGLFHDSNETWLWGGRSWVQLFPENTPPRRTAHTMIYDGLNDRVIAFGGRQEESVAGGADTLLADMWAFNDDGEWSQLADASGPGPRQYAGLAHDPERDVIVLFGGHEYLPLKPKQKIPDIGPVYDTWEFANGSWTKMAGTAPQVARPLLEWDPVKKQVVMMGIDGTTAAPVMYRYSDGTWTKETPAKMPTCITEGHLAVRKNGHLLFFGGVCPTGTPGAQELFEYDGTTWNKTTINLAVRGVGQAMAYDAFRDQIIAYGGTTLAGGDPLSTTLILTENGRWRLPAISPTPAARSWMVFESDPLARGIVLFGGLSESGGIYGIESWQYAGGKWGASPGVATAPPDCSNPVNTFDTDRQRLLALCSGNNIWEFDGTEWKDFGTVDIPDERRFSGIAYDAKLKKVVLFGGFFNNNYRNDTWLWDGSKWTELDIDGDDRPEHRGNFVMWYDAAQQKTLLYGGIGRPNLNTKVTRFSDMWSFDGTRWTKMNVTQTPGVRFRPLVHMNPVTGKLLLFGGLRAENVDADSIRQFYGDDTWEWDGASSTWTQLHPEHRPPARQNGGMAWDPTTNEMVMFGGWANGFSHSDVWAWNGVDWRVIPDLVPVPKRRSAR